LRTGTFEVVMLERGFGLGYDAVAVSLHRDYASYLELKNWSSSFPS